MDNEDLERAIEDIFNDCGNDKACLAAGTGWSTVWAFNASIMFIQAVNFIVMAIGGFFWYPRLCGTLFNLVCAFTCHFASVILMFNRRLRPFGDLCSNNYVTSTYNGDNDWDEGGNTYEDDANLMILLAVFQFLFWLVQCFCCCLPLLCTPKGWASHPKNDSNESVHGLTWK